MNEPINGLTNPVLDAHGAGSAPSGASRLRDGSADFAAALRERTAAGTRRWAADESPQRETSTADRARRRARDEGEDARGESPAQLAAAELVSPTGPGVVAQRTAEEMAAPSARTRAEGPPTAGAEGRAAGAVRGEPARSTGQAAGAAAKAEPSAKAGGQTPGPEAAGPAGGAGAAKARSAAAASPVVASASGGRALPGVSGAPAAGSPGVARGTLAGGPKGESRGLEGLKAKPTMASARLVEDPERAFAGQFQRGLEAALRQGGGSVTMRLKPDELGAMTITLDLRPGAVAASFEVGGEATRGLVEGRIETLKRALEERGLALEAVSVRVTGERDEARTPAGAEARGEQPPGGGGQAGDGGSRGHRPPADGSGVAPGLRGEGAAGGGDGSGLDGTRSVPGLGAGGGVMGAAGSWSDPIVTGGALRIRIDAVA